MGFSITLEELPRTLLGKIKRFAVRETYMPGENESESLVEPEELSEEDLELMKEDISRQIITYLEKQSTIKKTVVPGDLLELDLGIDSLGRIELAAGLEKLFDIKIKNEVIGNAFTVRDLITGIKPLLPEECGILSMDEIEEMTFGPGRWKEMLRVPPGVKSLEKIDLNPGWGAWVGGFVLSNLVRIICRVFFSLKVEGQENLPEKGPYMIYANHASYLDAFVLLASLPHLPKLDLFFIGYRVYFNVPIVRNLIKLGRIIPLDFSSHFLEALRSCFYVLKKGKVLCLFPEGLRTLDGNVRDFKKGFGILAKETGAKLVPVLMKGVFEAWPRTSRKPRRYPVKVIIGKAMHPEELEKRGFEKGAADSYRAICISAKEALVELDRQTKDSEARK
jgi:long-chain acyl-CoA synthetase